MTASRTQTGIGITILVAGLVVPAAAQGATRSTLDLSAGVGYSSNPSLNFDSESSIFGRLTALGAHEWQSERTTTSVSAYVENTTYSRDGSKQIFDLGARTNHSVSPNLSIFGNIGFQGDVDGQLSNRFTRPAPDLTPPPVDPAAPIVIDDPAFIVDDPTFIGFNGRQYRLSGQVGLWMRASERSSVTLSGGAQRNFSTGNLSNDFSTYFASAGYNHQLNERTSAGFSTNFQYQDYDNGRSSSVINPLLTVSRQFSDQLQGSAAVGLLFSRQDQAGGGSDSSIDPSFSFNLCRSGERDQLCVRASRDARNSLSVGIGPQSDSLVISTLGGISYFRRLDADQSVQASVSAVRSSTEFSGGDDFRSTYLTVLTGYDRRLGQRLGVGVNGGARRLFQSGRDPKADFNVSGYVRYRLGDIQ